MLPFFVSIGKSCCEGHLDNSLVNHSHDLDLSLGSHRGREPHSLLSGPHSPALTLILPGEHAAQLLSREQKKISKNHYLYFFHLKSVPVSSLLPEVVKTNPALGTFSMVNVVPVRPETGLASTNLETRELQEV